MGPIGRPETASKHQSSLRICKNREDVIVPRRKPEVTHKPDWSEHHAKHANTPRWQSAEFVAHFVTAFRHTSAIGEKQDMLTKISS